MIDQCVMNLPELVPNLPATIPTPGCECVMETASDSLFLTLPNTRTHRSTSRSMYEGTRRQSAFVAPSRGSSKTGQGTPTGNSPAFNCSGRVMCRVSSQAENANHGLFDIIEQPGSPVMNRLHATWTLSCFTASDVRATHSSCHVWTSACCFGIGCESGLGTGHDAD